MKIKPGITRTSETETKKEDTAACFFIIYNLVFFGGASKN
jgi:hypothetical protein